MNGEKGLTEKQRETLDRLAEIIIPSDGFDEGLRDAGFSGIIEARNMYQPWIAEIYDIGLQGVEEISQALYGKGFLELKEDESKAVLNSLISENPRGDVWTEKCSAYGFYTNLRQDACYVYCTDEDLWERIGFPGSAFEKGGYPDFADPQD